MSEALRNDLAIKDDYLLKPLRYILTGCDDETDLNKLFELIKTYLKDIVR
jgi:hypothetical protein